LFHRFRYVTSKCWL